MLYKMIPQCLQLFKKGSEQNSSILQLQLYLKLGFDEAFDWLFNELGFPYQTLPDVLTIK
jgi:hypothetical protein